MGRRRNDVHAVPLRIAGVNHVVHRIEDGGGRGAVGADEIGPDVGERSDGRRDVEREGGALLIAVDRASADDGDCGVIREARICAGGERESGGSLAHCKRIGSESRLHPGRQAGDGEFDVVIRVAVARFAEAHEGQGAAALRHRQFTVVEGQRESCKQLDLEPDGCCLLQRSRGSLHRNGVSPESRTCRSLDRDGLGVGGQRDWRRGGNGCSGWNSGESH